MKGILLWLTSPEWGQIVEALLHSLWQGGVLAVLLGLALRRACTPSLRYRLALGSLGGMLAATLVTWALLNQAASRQSVQAGNFWPAPVSTAQREHQPGKSGPTLVIAVGGAQQVSLAHTQAQWTAWLALAWLSGALLMLTRAGIQVAGAERLRRLGQPLEDARIAQLVAETQRALRFVRKIRVTVTHTMTSPAVVGVLVSTLILPLSLLTTLTHEQLRFVLLHELAHIRRSDYFANLLQLFVEALLFFNPAVWWVSQQIRREREACCDALAIELSGAPADYARTLVQVAEKVLNPSPAAAAAFGNKQREPSSLSDRVQRLLVPGYRPALRLTWRAMLMSLVAGGALLVLSALGTRNTIGAILADKKASDSPADVPSQTTLPDGQPKRLEFSNGRVAMVKKLSQIHLDRVHFESTPLSDVIRVLAQEARNCDPERKGINFLLDSRGQDTVNQDHTVGSVMVTINPALTNVSLADLTEIIVMVASQPISYSIQAFGVRFSLRKASESLVSRTIKVNPVTFYQRWLDRPNYVDAPAGTNRSFVVVLRAMGTDQPDFTPDPAEHPLRKLFAEAKLDLKPPKMVFYSDSRGELYVRATQEEIDKITQLLAEFGEESLPGPTQAASSPRTLVSESPTSPKASEIGELTNKVPVLGDLSLIGKLFTSNSNGQSGVLAGSDQFYVRRFKVDPNTFAKNLESTTLLQAKRTNVAVGVRDFFTSFGVELNPPKSIYFNDRAGELLIRATRQDLDVIEEALQALNAPIPQVNIKVRFVEVDNQSPGFGWFLGNELLANGVTHSATSDSSPQFSGILTEPQYRVALRAMAERKDAKVLAMQEVTTFSGRQAQIQTVELKTVVNGMNLPLPALPGPATTNSSTNPTYQTQVLPFGAVLDVIPFVSADGHTIQMTLSPTVTEFLGYDDPAKVSSGLRSRKRDGELPLPRMRVRQMSLSANVWDGQTLFLGTASDEIVSKNPNGSIERKASTINEKKQLLIFITPTIIDQGGNRIHAGEKVPADSSNSPQTPRR